MQTRLAIPLIVLALAAAMLFFPWSDPVASDEREPGLASHPESVGSLEFDPSAAADSQRIEIGITARRREVLVRVVDHVGHPLAEIHVVASATEPAKSSLQAFHLIEKPGSKQWSQRLTSDERGEVRLPWPEADVRSMYLWAEAPHAHSDLAHVEENADHREVVLRLPPVASFLVKVTDQQGSLIPRPHVSIWQDLRKADGSPGGSVGPALPAAAYVGEDPRGQYRIPVVADGREWRVQAKFDGTSFSKRARAPVRAGGETVVHLVVPADLILLRGRVVDGAALAVVDCRIRVLLDRGKSEVERPAAPFFLRDQRHGAVTDAQGRFWVSMPSEWLGDTLTRVRVRLLGISGKWTGAFGARPLDQCLVAGMTDIGEIELEQSPLLCAGTVRENGAKGWHELGMLGLRVVPRGERGEGIDGVHLYSDSPSGRFEARGTVAPGPLELRWGGEFGCLSGSLAFERGNQDLLVDVRTCERIAVAVRFPPMLHYPVNFRLAVLDGAGRRLPAAVTESGSSFTGGTTEAKGQEWIQVPVGKATIEVYLTHESLPVTRLEDLAVAKRSRGKPPLIDLRQSLRGTKLTAVDPNGRELSSSEGAWLCKRGTGWFLMRRTGGGIAVLHRPAGMDICLVVPGYPPQYVRASGGDLRVELQSRDETPWHLEHDLPRLPVGVEAWVEVSPTEARDGDHAVGRTVTIRPLSVPEPVLRSFVSKQRLSVFWPSDFAHRFRLLLGSGDRRSPCEATIKKKDGSVTFHVTPEERNRALSRLSK